MRDSLKGIVKCDSPGCGWFSAPDITLKELAHSKCPKCGSALMNGTDRAVLFLCNVLIAIGVIKNAKPEESHVYINTGINRSKADGTET